MVLLFQIALLAALAALVAVVVLVISLPADRPGPRLTVPPSARAPRAARESAQRKVVHLVRPGQAGRTQGT